MAVAVYGSAAAHQRAAIEAFKAAAEQQPDTMLQAFDAEVARATGSPPADTLPQPEPPVPHEQAAAVVRCLFDTRADQFMNLGPDIEKNSAVAGIHRRWLRLNQSSRASSEAVANARLDWRQARIRAYLATVCANTQETHAVAGPNPAAVPPVPPQQKSRKAA